MTSSQTKDRSSFVSIDEKSLKKKLTTGRSPIPRHSSTAKTERKRTTTTSQRPTPSKLPGGLKFNNKYSGIKKTVQPKELQK